jgi:hypothetical protein
MNWVSEGDRASSSSSSSLPSHTIPSTVPKSIKKDFDVRFARYFGPGKVWIYFKCKQSRFTSSM